MTCVGPPSSRSEFRVIGMSSKTSEAWTVSSHADISRWRRNRQNEIDAVHIYRALAQLESQQQLKEVYRRMAVVEEDHVRHWEEKLTAAEIVLPTRSPSLRAKVTAWLAKRFGVQAQLRRAAVSIPTNRVEGCARRSLRDYQRFVDVALGSAVEVRYLLDLTCDLGLLGAPAVACGKECSDHVVRALHQRQQALDRLAT